LIEQRVAAKVTPASPAEIDTFFTRNRGQMAGRTLEQSASQIAATIHGSRVATARAEYVRTLRKRYDARVLLEPPRIAVSPDDDPSRGPAQAPITIVEFSDFQCPFCSRGQDTIDQVVKQYGDRVKLVFRDFPLSIHPNAEGAAIAAGCAREQGKYWEMNRALFADPGELSAADLAATAGSIGLDVERFKACMASGESRAEVQKDMADGQSVGVSGTPTFFVNGVMIVGARELDVFTRTIDRELERQGQSR
jgi:protein-disulfide isomerase